MGLDDVSDQNVHSIADSASSVLTCGNVSFLGLHKDYRCWTCWLWVREDTVTLHMIVSKSNELFLFFFFCISCWGKGGDHRCVFCKFVNIINVNTHYWVIYIEFLSQSSWSRQDGIFEVVLMFSLGWGSRYLSQIGSVSNSL